MRFTKLMFVLVMLLPAVPDLLSQETSRELLSRAYDAEFQTPPVVANAGFTAFRFPAGSELSLPGQDLAAKAYSFWEQFGDLYNSSSSQMHLLRQSVDHYGKQHLVFQQHFQYPVFGAEVSLHFNQHDALYAVQGFYVTSEQQSNGHDQQSQNLLPPLRQIMTDEAFLLAARNHLFKQYPGQVWEIELGPLNLLANTLIGNGRNDLAWVRQLTLREQEGLKVYDIFLDHATGQLILEIQQHCSAMHRELYNGSVNNSNLLWEEGDNFPGGLSADRQSVLNSTAETYNLFRYTFGRDSYDGQGGDMNIVAYTNSSCPNAFASGSTASFCSGVTADDVVGHEWAHNYTGSINGLIYAWESGAINEGFSDVFGEVVDLLNTSGNDQNDDQLRTVCNESGNERWKVGEDATAFGGHLRDMYQPECKNDPSARNAPDFSCAASDNGGVHTNSGVLNRSFSMLTDGDMANGVTGIGLTKATHVFHQAWTNYTTRVTDYDALATALANAANDLVGQNLTSLTVQAVPPGPSGQVFTAADALQVSNVIMATAMNQPSNCPASPALDPASPPICAAVSTDYVGIFSEDWETGMSGWTVDEVPSNPADWTPKSWNSNGNLPDNRGGQGVFIVNNPVGDCSDDFENGYVDLLSPQVSIPAEATEIILNFDHYFSIENGWDGGHLFLIRNGGAATHVDGSHFIFNSYVRNLNTNGNDNPMSGLGTFTGSDNNSTSGSWGQSQVDLSQAGVQAGDDVQLVFRMSYDGCNGWLGWYLDEVALSYCKPNALPVDYLSFTAKPLKEAIQLAWATARELENTGFEITRRSEIEDQFQKLGFLAAAAPGRNGNYRFTDQDVRSGVTYYYQLRQIDADGSSNNSPIVRAKIDKTASGFSVFPNPASQGSVFLDWNGDPSPAGIQLYNSSGQLLQSWNEILPGTSLNISKFSKGVYWLRKGELASKLILL